MALRSGSDFNSGREANSSVRMREVLPSIARSLLPGLQAEKQEQEMAEACKRLIKNCIICWNHLYLSQQLAEMDAPRVERRF